MISKFFSTFTIILIKLYQFFISPLLGVNCRFYPTCSVYSIEALNKYGFLKGFILSSKRILSCHPFGPHGFRPLIEGDTPLVKKISAKEIQSERKVELYKKLPESFSKYNEDELRSTIHLALFLNGELVSGLTLIKKKLNNSNSSSFQIRGMFTKKKFCNRGYGSILIKYVKDEVSKSLKMLFFGAIQEKSYKFLYKKWFC